MINLRIQIAIVATMVFSGPSFCQTCPSWSGPWKGKLGKVSQRTATHCMSDGEIEQLIQLGRGYKTLEKLWDDEFRGRSESTNADGHREIGEGNEFRVTTWYTATKIQILTDAWKIAGAAQRAKHELRDFSVAAARSVADGSFTVQVISADQGLKQNATRNVHLVMDFAGELLQPANKNESNTSLSTRVGFAVRKSSTMTGRFAFLLPASHGPTARLILIGNNDKQRSESIDFSKLR